MKYITKIMKCCEAPSHTRHCLKRANENDDICLFPFSIFFTLCNLIFLNDLFEVVNLHTVILPGTGCKKDTHLRDILSRNKE